MQRRTAQREAIKQVLIEAGRALGPNEILDEARGQSPGMGIATVYRTVKSLVESGWLVTVDIPGEPPRYEVVRPQHHHHFHCRVCGRVFPVDHCSGNFRAMTPPGFHLESHEVILRGVCQECVADEERDTSPEASATAG